MKQAIRHLQQADPVMAGIIERIGPFKMHYREPSFEAMARSIVFQQLHGKAAATIFERVRTACHGVCGPGSLTQAGRGEAPPPHGQDGLTPVSILALSEEQLRACGLSRQKLSYLRDLAQRTASGEIEFARLPKMSDEDVIEHLTRVKGIGVWSAQMFLIFALRRLNVMPTADYGINLGIKRAYRKRQMPKPKQILKISRPWQPYCSIACWYLWRYSELKEGK
ncbi:MAG TPA: DNA-3-methyladenine glycosylase [Terriglobales bacterium]|jgi:DNA-3-methyladenine glycosylase II|nr:DNA-3-methyladenine glycosylase [Terriglobales bacterium]